MRRHLLVWEGLKEAYGMNTTYVSYPDPVGDTDLRMMISCDRQAGAKLALVGRQSV